MGCAVACEGTVLRLAAGKTGLDAVSKDHSSVEARRAHRNQSTADLRPLDRFLWPDLLETLEDSRPILFAERQRLSYSAGPCDCGLAALCRSIQDFENLCFRLPSRTAICRSRSTPRGPSARVPFRLLIDWQPDPVLSGWVYCRFRSYIRKANLVPFCIPCFRDPFARSSSRPRHLCAAIYLSHRCWMDLRLVRGNRASRRLYLLFAGPEHRGGKRVQRDPVEHGPSYSRFTSRPFCLYPLLEEGCVCRGGPRDDGAEKWCAHRHADPPGELCGSRFLVWKTSSRRRDRILLDRLGPTPARLLVPAARRKGRSAPYRDSFNDTALKRSRHKVHLPRILFAVFVAIPRVSVIVRCVGFTLLCAIQDHSQ